MWCNSVQKCTCPRTIIIPLIIPFSDSLFVAFELTFLTSDKQNAGRFREVWEQVTHPCFSPLLIGNGSQEEPSYWMIPYISSWKPVIILRSLEGHPILRSRVTSPFLLTKSKALVRSINAMYNGPLCSRNFFSTCLSEKIMSIVDLLALSPHCASGYMRSASNCNLFSITRAKAFPTILRRDILRWLLQSLRSPLFLKSVLMLASRMSWGTVPSSLDP